MARREVVDIIKRYIQNLNTSGIHINKVFLYGSYARNEATDESDIDVLLISDVFDTTDDRILAKPWSLSLRVDHRIEPYPVGTKQFLSDDVSPLIEIVKQEGIEIKF